MSASTPPIILGDGAELAREEDANPDVSKVPIRRVARSNLVFMS
jgi:hypothetical protein